MSIETRRAGALAWLLPAAALAVAAVTEAPAAETGPPPDEQIEERMRATEAELDQRAEELERKAEAYEARKAEMAARKAGEDAALEARLEEARTELEAAAREVAELSARLAGDAGLLALRELPRMGGRRPMLGINIGDGEEGDGGVRVLGVSPGGPAEEAGMRSGDVLTAIGGEDLTGPEGVQALRDYELASGEPVALTVKRDGKTLSVEVVPEEMSPFDVFVDVNGEGFSFNLDDLAALEALDGLEALEVLPRAFVHRLGHAHGLFDDMELVTLTPGLGSYFGVEEGLLVVRAPGDPGAQLADGDVIVRIDGREPQDPGHAMRILRSYEPGETLTLGIIRKQRPADLTLEVPEPPAHGMPAPPPEPEPAAPPER